MKIFAFVAASGAGKTTVLRRLGAEPDPSQRFVGKSERHGTVVPYKPSTRDQRSDDFEIQGNSPMPKRDSYVYRNQGKHYAIRRADLEHALDQGLNPALVVNDVPTIDRLMDRFGEKVVIPVYIHSNTTAQHIAKLQRERGALAGRSELDKELDVIRRSERLVRIHGEYVFRPELFRHTILNTGTIDQLYAQVDSIVDHQRVRNGSRAYEPEGPRVIPIDGASGSGRATLLKSALDALGGAVAVAVKYSDRACTERDDPRLIACGKPIPAQCDIKYALYDAAYGISSGEIARDLESGRHVLVPTSDPGAMAALRERFGDAVAQTYLFADVNASRGRALETHGNGSRANGVDANFAGYVDNIATYRHVILNVNPGEPLAQLTSIVEHYGKP